jgi:hypothetical protein
MLPEERRKQLDGIVQKMTVNREPEANVQRVVADFKMKYGAKETPSTPLDGFMTVARNIKNDVVSNVQEGADTYTQAREGKKNPILAGFGIARNVTGAMVAPVTQTVGAALGTVVNPVVNAIANKVSDSTAVQDFAAIMDKHPDLGNAINDLTQTGLNMTVVGGGPKVAGKVATRVKTSGAQMADTIKSTVTPDISPVKIATERRAKLNEGFETQNTRLKSVGKSFEANTKTYKDPKTNTTTTVTPIDTFAKYDVAPVIENGTIKMGDYQTGTGELGKLKAGVDNLDSQIDTLLTDTKQTIPTEDIIQSAIQQAIADPTLKASGKVNVTIKKLMTILDDYSTTYGDTLTPVEINNIRKVMNKDWSPETMDTSRIIGDAAREIVYNSTPDMEVRSLLRNQGELLAAKKYAETINGTKVVGGRLGNMAMRTAGAIIGSTVSKLPVAGPIIGMIGGEYAARALQQTQFRSAWTELKALLQSNSTEPTQSANITPNSATISPKRTTTK